MAEHDEIPELLCAVVEDDPKEARRLLENGANPNLPISGGKSILVFAVLIGHEMVNVLLEHGANPNVQDENGRTPLMLAVIDEGTGYETIDALLSYGADPDLQDNNGRTALMLAAAGKDGCMEILLPALIRTGGIRVRESASWCAFALAYDAMQRDRQLEVVRRLIACGADVNIRSRSGMGALEYAVVTKDTELLELLMSGSKKDLGAV